MDDESMNAAGETGAGNTGTGPGAHRRKPKLSVDGQIEHLRAKGVTFELCDEDEARAYLADKTYYYKLAAYRALFQKRVGGDRDGEYIGLDFGHLRDLASIDQMLRYALLPMTLDVEHFAKTKLMRGLTERPDEDGYGIVRDYFGGLKEHDRRMREGELRRLRRDPYSGGMALRYEGDMPAWAYIELLSFGSFIDFYLFCSARWDDGQMKREHYWLRQAKSVRNCCAHSTDLFNGFASDRATDIRTPAEVAAALDALGFNKRARQSKMRNPGIQQITILAYAYRELVRGDSSRRACRERVAELEARATEHAEWYANVDPARSSYLFLSKVLDHWV